MTEKMFMDHCPTKGCLNSLGDISEFSWGRYRTVDENLDTGAQKRTDVFHCFKCGRMYTREWKWEEHKLEDANV